MWQGEVTIIILHGKPHGSRIVSDTLPQPGSERVIFKDNGKMTSGTKVEQGALHRNA